MGLSLKKLFTPPKAIRSLVEGLPGIGTVLKAGQALGGALEKQPRPPGMAMMLTSGMPISMMGGPCPPGTVPASTMNQIFGSAKCVPISGGGGMPAVPGIDMGGMPAGLTPAAIAAYCALSTGGGRMRLAPSPCRGFHWNESRYYVFGDCRTGSQPGIVERGNKLVRNRRINPANAQAARRAVRRLNGTYSLLRSIEKSMVKLGGRSIRAARSSSKRRGCAGGCKGKCTC